MVSYTLSQLVQDHRELLVASVVDKLRHEALESSKQWISHEAYEWFNATVASLDQWPLPAHDRAQQNQQRKFAAQLAHAGIPLHEAVGAFQMLKNAVIDYVRSQGIAWNAVGIYAQEEFEHRVGLYFDWLLYQAAYGYEEELAARPGEKAAATAKGEEPSLQLVWRNRLGFRSSSGSR